MPTPHEKAKTWRKKHGLSREQLSELIGYSPETIWWMERGETCQGRDKGGKQIVKPVAEWVWRRYQLACAGLENELKTGRSFKW